MTFDLFCFECLLAQETVCYSGEVLHFSERWTRKPILQLRKVSLQNFDRNRNIPKSFCGSKSAFSN